MFLMVFSSVLIIMILILTFCALYKREGVDISIKYFPPGIIFLNLKKQVAFRK